MALVDKAADNMMAADKEEEDKLAADKGFRNQICSSSHLFWHTRRHISHSHMAGAYTPGSWRT